MRRGCDIDIQLAVAPLFGMPPPLCTPLGLAYLNGALRAAGCAPRFRDLAAEVFRHDPALHARLFEVAMPRAGGYYGVDLPRLLACLAPASWPDPDPLALRVHQWAREAASEGDAPHLCLLHLVDANVYASAAYALALRARGAVVIAGGPGVRLPHVRQVLLDAGALDAAVVGEGEPLVAALADAIARGDALDTPAWAAQGLHAAGAPAHAVGAPPLADLHALPWPSFEGMPLHDVLPALASRGCIRDCSFCSERTFWSRFRLRRVEDVVAELEHQQAQWGPRRVFFHDDLVNANPRWLSRLAEALIARDAPWPWDCYMEPARLDAALAARLKASGLIYVRLGVEHLSEPMLAAMRRSGGLPAVERAIGALADAGIDVFFDLVVGHPGEREEDHQANLDGVERLLGARPHVGVSVNPFCLLDGAPTGLTPDAFGVQVEHLDPATLPPRWASLRPLAGSFITRHVQSPPPEVVLARAEALRDRIEALGRRANLTR